ncbi:hypothetical protein [Thalassospira sp. GB04J01]|uniref:hypothetical protein n=1 Tax=Thalassospira sp. GB04J01 TaxID=1485225 RepID=UPI001304AFFA|nr:hypothetical protein [Thalassospira sp. GB04J01]
MARLLIITLTRLQVELAQLLVLPLEGLLVVPSVLTHQKLQLVQRLELRLELLSEVLLGKR